MRRLIIFIFILFQSISNAQRLGDSIYIAVGDTRINYEKKIKIIKEHFERTDTVFQGIDTLMTWKFIASTKKGWEASHGIYEHKGEFDNLYIPNDNSTYTFNDLKTKFYLTKECLIPEISNEKRCSVRMSFDKKYMIIRTGSHYPNGGASSWSYNEVYYFINDNLPEKQVNIKAEFKTYLKFLTGFKVDDLISLNTKQKSYYKIKYIAFGGGDQIGGRYRFSYTNILKPNENIFNEAYIDSLNLKKEIKVPLVPLRGNTIAFIRDSMGTINTMGLDFNTDVGIVVNNDQILSIEFLNFDTVILHSQNGKTQVEDDEDLQGLTFNFLFSLNKGKYIILNKYTMNLQGNMNSSGIANSIFLERYDD